MRRRVKVIAAALAAALVAAVGVAGASSKADPGVSSKSILIGGTLLGSKGRGAKVLAACRVQQDRDRIGALARFRRRMDRSLRLLMKGSQGIRRGFGG